jgi:hypothetical protein
MTELLFFAFMFFGSAVTFVSLCIGFKLGRTTKGVDTNIIPTKIKKTGKNTLDSPDVFTEHLNDGPEGDTDERLRTV